MISDLILSKHLTVGSVNSENMEAKLKDLQLDVAELKSLLEQASR